MPKATKPLYRLYESVDLWNKILEDHAQGAVKIDSMELDPSFYCAKTETEDFLDSGELSELQNPHG